MFRCNCIKIKKTKGKKKNFCPLAWPSRFQQPLVQSNAELRFECQYVHIVGSHIKECTEIVLNLSSATSTNLCKLLTTFVALNPEKQQDYSTFNGVEAFPMKFSLLGITPEFHWYWKVEFCSKSFGLVWFRIDCTFRIKSGPRGIRPSTQTKATIRISDSPL